MLRKLLESKSIQEKFKLDPERSLFQHFNLPTGTCYERLRFGISKKYTEYKVKKKKWDPWDRITDGLIIGKIPNITECDEIIEFAELTGKPLGLVVSVVDYYELGGNIAFSKKIATPKDWAAKGIKHLSIPDIDFDTQVPIECILNIIGQMRECEAKGLSTYIHCKAGRGRSVMVGLIYLCVYDSELKKLPVEEALQQAFKSAQLKRFHIGLASDKIAKALKTIPIGRLLLEEKEPSISESINTKDKNLPEALSAILVSTQTKADISQLTSFKELAIYATFSENLIFSGKRTQCIKDLFMDIFTSKNADWFLNFDQKMQPFLNANPFLCWDRTKSHLFTNKEKDTNDRRNLVADFKKEISDYLIKKIGCKPESLTGLLDSAKKMGKIRQH